MQYLKNGNVSPLNCIYFLQLSLLADWIMFLNHPLDSEAISPNLQRLSHVLSVAHFQPFANDLSLTSFAARCGRNKQAASLAFLPHLRLLGGWNAEQETTQESVFLWCEAKAGSTALVPVESKQPCSWALETLAHASSPRSWQWNNWLPWGKFSYKNLWDWACQITSC